MRPRIWNKNGQNWIKLVKFQPFRDQESEIKNGQIKLVKFQTWDQESEIKMVKIEQN